eukprot:21177-Heterococcus_DN1.PRE.1
MQGYIDCIYNNTPYTFEMTGCARLRAARSDAQIDLTGGDGMPRRCKGDVTPGRHRCSGIDIPAYHQPLLQVLALICVAVAIMCTGPQEKLITAQICGTAVELTLHQACLPANGGFHHVTLQDALIGKILARRPVPDGGSNATATYQTHLIFDMAGSDVVMKLQVMNVSYVGKIIHSTSASSAFYTAPLTAVIYKGKPDINTTSTSTTPVTTAAPTVGASNSSYISTMCNSNGIVTSNSISAVPSDEEWESVAGNSNSSGNSSGNSGGSSGSSRGSSSDNTTERSSNSSI